MKKYYFIVLTVIVFACGSKDRENISSEQAEQKSERMNAPQAQKNSYQEVASAYGNQTEKDKVPLSSSAAQPTGDSLGQFIRTANLKFKTKNVAQSSFGIEDLVVENGGYIQHSSIRSEIQQENTVKFSRDSAWKVTQFVTVNSLTARVPVEKLHETLKALRPFVVHLDHRVVDAENIGFDLFYNKLKQSRIAVYSLKSQQFSPKDQAEVSDQVLQRQMESDEAQVENMRMFDKIRFSTIEIYMYQNPEVRKEKVAVYQEMEAYREPFGMQFLESLSDGWSVIKNLVLFLVKAWSVILILFGAWFAYRMMRARK